MLICRETPAFPNIILTRAKISYPPTNIPFGLEIYTVSELKVTTRVQNISVSFPGHSKPKGYMYLPKNEQ